MMRKFNFLNLLFWSLIALTSCTEIFEKDIEKEEITIYTPNGKDSINYSQTFWWSQVDFATNYQLTVVSPSFAAPEKMILDTIVQNNRFIYYLGPGKFEWQVRGMNGGYKTKYFGNKFKIDTTEISLQTVNLKFPVNSKVLAEGLVEFEWSRLLGAKGYQFQLDSTQSYKKPIVNDFRASTTYSYNLSISDTYFWRVRAYNDKKDTTDWSEFKFILDNSTPLKVALLSPLQSASNQNQSGTLKWNDLGPGYKYTVYIQVGSGQGIEYPNQTSASYNYPLISKGQEVKWKVKAVSAAGLEGPYSDLWSFTIQP
jgi:hypothetical protein